MIDRLFHNRLFYQKFADILSHKGTKQSYHRQLPFLRGRGPGTGLDNRKNDLKEQGRPNYTIVSKIMSIGVITVNLIYLNKIITYILLLMGQVENCCVNKLAITQFIDDIMQSVQNDYFRRLFEEILALEQNKSEIKYRGNIRGNWNEGDEMTGSGIIYEHDFLYYQGQFIRGQPNGEGLAIWKNTRNRYKGQFVNFKANGKGQFSDKDRNIILKGSWINGLPKVNTPMQFILR